MSSLYRHPPDAPRFPWRIAVYSIVIAYLFVDLYLLNGPLRRRIHAGRPGSASVRDLAKEHGWVARVNAVPITRAQLDRAVDVHNFKRGTTTADLSEKNRLINRLAALDELVEDQLLKGYARNTPVPVSDETVDAELDRFTRQFASGEELHAHLAEQDIPPDKLRDHIAEHVGQIAWIENRISESIVVTDEEARAWFANNNEFAAIPDLIRARHIFLSTVNHDPAEREIEIRDIHRQLLGGEHSFEELARSRSEDERSRDAGGDLNWFTRRRMPEDFMNALQNLNPGDLSAPFRTSLGWHIAEVTERKPARQASFDEVEADVRALLETEKRRIAAKRLMTSLRKGSVIEFFPENL